MVATAGQEMNVHYKISVVFQKFSIALMFKMIQIMNQNFNLGCLKHYLGSVLENTKKNFLQ